MAEKLKIFAPATIANIGSGYDIMSLAINQPGDIIEFIKREDQELYIHNKCEEFPDLPLDPAENVTTYAMSVMMEEFHINRGFDIIFHQKIRPGSGLGSSAASSCAGVFALNELLNLEIQVEQLIKYASEGERLACGTPILDNVTSCMKGGVSLIRSFEPIDIVDLEYPKDLFIAYVHPYIKVLTEQARSAVPKEVGLELATQQWANTAGLVAGLASSDFKLIGRSTQDVVVEPFRKSLIKGFDNVKRAALSNGGLNCSISGAGPALFSFCENEDIARQVSEKMQLAFDEVGISAESYHSTINSEGIKVLSE